MLASVPKLLKRNRVKKSVRGEQENNSFAGDFLPIVLDFFPSFWGVGVGCGDSVPLIFSYIYIYIYISAGFKALTLSFLYTGRHARRMWNSKMR